MPVTYDKIATTTLGSSSATITFNSIGSGYTDLKIVLNGIGTAGAGNSAIRFNNDSTAIYASTFLGGDGSSATSQRNTNDNEIEIDIGGYGSAPQLYTIDIFSYAGATFKGTLTTQSSDQNGSGRVTRSVGVWRSTSAITRVDLIIVGGGSYDTGTTATLYGILKA
jgi:hypothetical protein